MVLASQAVLDLRVVLTPRVVLASPVVPAGGAAALSMPLSARVPQAEARRLGAEQAAASYAESAMAAAAPAR